MNKTIVKIKNTDDNKFTVATIPPGRNKLFKSINDDLMKIKELYYQLELKYSDKQGSVETLLFTKGNFTKQQKNILQFLIEIEFNKYNTKQYKQLPFQSKVFINNSLKIITELKTLLYLDDTLMYGELTTDINLGDYGKFKKGNKHKFLYYQKESKLYVFLFKNYSFPLTEKEFIWCK